MNLATYQRTLKTLFMTPSGKASLEDETRLARFLSELELTADEQEQLLRQGLPRLRQYDHMLLANVKENLAATCPNTHAVLGDDWDALMLKFFFACPPQTYRLQSIAGAFPDFLDATPEVLEKSPFVAELALLEWMECELMVAPNLVLPDSVQPAIPMDSAELAWMGPVLNSVGTMLTTDYPLHRILEQLRTQNQVERSVPQPSCYWIYRTDHPYLCKYLPLDGVLGYWLRLVREANIQGEPMSYAESIELSLDWAQRTHPGLDSDTWRQCFCSVIAACFAEGILAGSYPVNPADQSEASHLASIAQIVQELSQPAPDVLGERYTAAPEIPLDAAGQWQPEIQVLETTRTMSRFGGSRGISTWFSHLYTVEPEVTHEGDLVEEDAGWQCGSSSGTE